MALKRSYDSEDEIPEALREYYTEKDGKWILDAEPGEGERHAEDVRRALGARDNEKAEREKLRKELDELKSVLVDVDIAQIPDAIEALKGKEELEQKKLIDEGKLAEAIEKKYERQIAEQKRAIENASSEREELDRRLAAQRERLQTHLIRSELQKAFIEAKTDPAKLKFLMLEAQGKWEIDDETDQPVPIDWIDGGKTKITATGSDGKQLTMAEHVKTILAENPWAMLESSGSNARHQTSTNGTDFTISADDASDFTKYKAAREQAEKAGSLDRFQVVR